MACLTILVVGLGFLFIINSIDCMSWRPIRDDLYNPGNIYGILETDEKSIDTQVYSKPVNDYPIGHITSVVQSRIAQSPVAQSLLAQSTSGQVAAHQVSGQPTNRPISSLPVTQPPSTRSTIIYKLGKRVNGDRIVASSMQSQIWPTMQNITQTLSYPKTGVGSIITYVEITVDQSSNLGQARVTSGGVGQRQISIIIDAYRTIHFLDNILIYGY